MIPWETCGKLWKVVAAVAILIIPAPAATATQGAAVHWEAQWIWPSQSAIATHKNQFMLFRKTFTLAQTASKADLAIFADSRYRLYVNGDYIGQGPARAPARYYYYDIFDVASKLRPGLNVIAVEARWFGQGMAWYEEPPIPRDFGARSHGALLCQLEIGEGANRQIVKTDATWKATEDHAWDWNTPQVNNSLAAIEVYHLDRVVKGWTQPQFDDSGWTPVEVMRGFWGLTSPPMGPYIHLVPRPLAYPLEKEIIPGKVVSAGVFSGGAMPPFFFGGGNPLATLGKSIAGEKHEPEASILGNAAALTSDSSSDYAEVQPGANGKTPYVILDMGREVDGYLQFSVESEKPADIVIGWSEMMEHGDITANEPGGDYVAEYDTAPGSQHWTMWGWHAMRFVELSFPNLTAPLKFRVNMRFSTAKLNHAGSFSSSSPLLTKLWQMGAYTWQLCTLDGTMDCPSREQHQWLGDGEIELRVNGVADGNLDIAQKFLLDASRDAWRDGAIPMVSDMGGNTTILIDDYVFSFINALQEYYLETGDKGFALRLYPSVARAMMWFQGYQQPDGLLGPMPYWVFLDWSNPDKKGESAILNALYVHTLENAAGLADMAGDRYHAGIFRADIARIRRVYNERFWNGSRDLYVDAWDHGNQSDHIGQLANADAVQFGFAPADRAQEILKQITDPSRLRIGGLNPATNQFEIEGRSGANSQTIVQAQTYGMFFVLQALGAHGHADLVRQYIEKYWGPMAAAGNDTFWENFIQATGTSCHAWSAAPTYFLSTLILGVRPTKPGYAEYDLAPHPAGLEWAKGAVPTVHGLVQVDWKWESDSHFVLRFHNPPDETAHIVLPQHEGKNATSVTLNGKSVTGTVLVKAPGDYTAEGRY